MHHIPNENQLQPLSRDLLVTCHLSGITNTPSVRFVKVLILLEIGDQFETKRDIGGNEEDEV